mmetsp:Transcript_121439/g.271216  ORF Transcript_121439/g.271216 Transcript_121439/m.271216 type:complete len:268 (-) Transcript_121439:2435-3238(-)
MESPGLPLRSSGPARGSSGPPPAGLPNNTNANAAVGAAGATAHRPSVCRWRRAPQFTFSFHLVMLSQLPCFGVPVVGLLYLLNDVARHDATILELPSCGVVVDGDTYVHLLRLGQTLVDDIANVRPQVLALVKHLLAMGRDLLLLLVVFKLSGIMTQDLCLLPDSAELIVEVLQLASNDVKLEYVQLLVFQRHHALLLERLQTLPLLLLEKPSHLLELLIGGLLGFLQTPELSGHVLPLLQLVKARAQVLVFFQLRLERFDLRPSLL